jgi:hypothetical protein
MPTEEEVKALIVDIKNRIIYVLAENGIEDDSLFDTLEDDMPLLAGIYSSSIMHRVATGPRAGMKVRKMGDFCEPIWDDHLLGQCTARLDGFSLHGSEVIPAWDRKRLERLLRYIFRPPIPNERLSILNDGTIKLELKTEWNDGTTDLLFSPLEFLEKLVALIPKPKVNLIIYHGVLAPRSQWREAVVTYASPERARKLKKRKEKEYFKAPSSYIPWCFLMARVFKLDVLVCPKCGYPSKIIASIDQPEVIRKILDHLGLRPAPSENTASPRSPPQELTYQYELFDSFER